MTDMITAAVNTRGETSDDKMNETSTEVAMPPTVAPTGSIAMSPTFTVVVAFLPTTLPIIEIEKAPDASHPIHANTVEAMASPIAEGEPLSKKGTPLIEDPEDPTNIITEHIKATNTITITIIDVVRDTFFSAFCPETSWRNTSLKFLFESEEGHIPCCSSTRPMTKQRLLSSEEIFHVYWRHAQFLIHTMFCVFSLEFNHEWSGNTQFSNVTRAYEHNALHFFYLYTFWVFIELLISVCVGKRRVDMIAHHIVTFALCLIAIIFQQIPDGVIVISVTLLAEPCVDIYFLTRKTSFHFLGEFLMATWFVFTRAYLFFVRVTMQSVLNYNVMADRGLFIVGVSIPALFVVLQVLQWFWCAKVFYHAVKLIK